MKKITLLFFALFSFLANAQVQVGSGTTNISTVPVSSCWGYSYTQQLYLASEINTNGNITELSFYYESGAPAANSADWTIYLGHTTKTIFSTTTDWEPLTNLTQAYTGTVTYPGAPGWMTITLDTPFSYNGTDNLVVAVDENAAGFTCSVNFKGFAATNRGIYYRNDTTNPDPAAPPTGTRTSTIANIILGGIVPTNPPACTALTTPANGAVNVFGSTVSWAGAAGSPTGYLINVGTSSGATDVLNNQDVGNVLSYDLGTVAPATTYYVTIIAYNDNGEATGCTETSFTTCSINSVPSIENFTTFVPACWQKAENGDATSGPAIFGTSSWVADGFSNSSGTGAMKINIDDVGDNDWMISPLFTIPATGYEVRFNAAVTQWNGTGAPTTPWESDDFVEVLVSNGTANWTVLYTYNDTNVPAFSGATNTIDLSAYAGQNVRFAFRGVEGAANGGADVDFFIDNFEIRLTPSCSEPLSLVANTITSSSANITWAPTTGSYEYVLDNVATDPAGSGTPLSGEVYSPSLTPLTTYYFHVRTVCPGPLYSTWSTVSFTTPATPPANDNCSGAIALTVNSDFSCGVVTAGTVVGATASAVDAAACFGTEDDDVWFSFVATQATHRISILNVAGSVTDMYHSLWTGADCNSLTLVTGSCSDPNTSNPSGLVIGQTYYVRVNTYTATGGQTSTFNICIGTPPPPPANDACATAIGIVTLPYTNTQDASAATNNGGYIATCTGTSGMNDGVWYSVVGNGADITVNINSVVGWDPELAVYTGTCGAFTCVGSVDVGASGGSESYTITGSVIGTTYYINIGYYSGTSNSSEGAFAINVTTNLSTDSFDSAAFKAYPNPVKDVLNLSYSSEISSVEVYNMLGQKVITKNLNITQGQIDMSNLTSGNYIVKVTSEGLTKTIKVVKQ